MVSFSVSPAVFKVTPECDEPPPAILYPLSKLFKCPVPIKVKISGWIVFT
jgi:hypothetical protein